MINYGYCFRPDPSIVLVDANKDLMADFYFEDKITSYRSFVFDAPMTIARPEINCTQLNNEIILSAPPNHHTYVWSNGEEASNIRISEPGTYQVWVDYGNAMIGSLPFVVEDINEVCINVGLEEVGKVALERKVLAIYDILGRKVREVQLNQLYCILYDDQHVEKVVYLD